MFTRTIIEAVLAMFALTYVVELCLAPAQIRRLQYEHANWIAQCLQWSRQGLDPEAKLAALQVEQLRKEIDFLRSMLRPWQRARRLVTLALAALSLVACSGADFETASGNPPTLELPDSGATPVVRSRLPQDALAPFPDADAGVFPPEGTGGRPGAGGAPASTGGSGASTGGASASNAGGTASTGGSSASTGGSVALGTGGTASIRTPAEVLQSLNRPDCIVDSLTVNCSEWRPTVDVHPVGLRCSASPPIAITAPGCHQAGPVGNLWCCLP